MTEFERLVVVSSASWLAKDFSAPSVITVIPEVGFDLPRLDPKTTAWWCSGSYVARAASTGLIMPLLSAGPHWLPTLPSKWKRREVEAIRMKEVENRFTTGFIKPAEIKIGSLPARIYRSSDEFLQDASEVGLPDGSWLTVSEPMAYVREYRCFTAHGEVTAATPYLIDGMTWDGLDSDADGNGCSEARAFVERMLADIGTEAHPPGFVVDVGVDTDGHWSVIEANASWSSNPYHADMGGVIRSVLAAHDVDGQYPQWAWKIDPYHEKNARKLYWKEMK